MKSTLSKKVVIWRSAVILISLLVVISCRKNQQNPASGSGSANNLDVNVSALKASYSRDTAVSLSLNSVLLHIPNSGGQRSSMIRNRNVQWGSMRVIKKDSSKVIEFDMQDPSDKWTIDAAPANTRNKTMLVFIQYASGRQMSFFMKAIEGITSSSSVINNIHYQNIPQSFSGSVMYYNLNSYFLNGWVYQGGKLTKSIAGSTKAHALSLNRTPAAIQQIALEAASITEVCYEAYNYNYVAADGPSSGVWVDSGYMECYYEIDDDGGGGSGGGGGVSGGSGGGGGSSSPAPPPPCNPPASAVAVLRGGKKINLVAAPPPGGGGSGGSGGTTPCTTVTTPPPAKPLNPAKVSDLLKKFHTSTLTAAELAKFTNIVNMMDATVVGDKILTAIDAYYTSHPTAATLTVTNATPSVGTDEYVPGTNTINMGDTFAADMLSSAALYATAHEMYHSYEAENTQSAYQSNFELDAYMFAAAVVQQSSPDDFSSTYETNIEVQPTSTTPLTAAQSAFNTAWTNYLDGNTSASNYTILDNDFLTGSKYGPNYKTYTGQTVTNNPGTLPLFFKYMP